MLGGVLAAVERYIWVTLVRGWQSAALGFRHGVPLTAVCQLNWQRFFPSLCPESGFSLIERAKGVSVLTGLPPQSC